MQAKLRIGVDSAARDKTFFVDFVPRRRRVRGQIVEIIVSRHGRRFLNLPAALQPRDHRPHRMEGRSRKEERKLAPAKTNLRAGEEPKPVSRVEENRNTDSALGNPAQDVRRGKQ